MKLAKGRMPPTDGIDRWRFPVAEKVMLHASGRDLLVNKIFEYRLRNNIEIGDIERDLDKFYCTLYPTFCHSEPSDTDPSILRQSSEPMLNRVSRWAAVVVRRMPRGGYPLVTSAEADSRALICTQCPKQDAAWKGGCGGCSASTLQLLQQIKSLRRTSRDGNLSACKIAGFENSTAIWLPPEATAITEEQRAAMPPFCWRKAIP